MSCRCGKKIEYQEGIVGREEIKLPMDVGRHGQVPQVSFEYIGKTGLTVLGPITMKRYRFGYPDAVVAVDPRDAPSFIAVPNLRRL